MRQESAPATVQKAMLPGGLSLSWQALALGPGGALTGVHLYCVPPKGTSRSDIGPGTTITSSRFYVELWSLTPLKSVNRILFYEDGDASQLRFAWVDERLKTVPILRLRFGVGDVGEWKVLSFPKGVLKPAVLQSFSFAENSFLELDKREQGKLIFKERWTNDQSQERTALYRYNGARFIDEKALWFVLGPTAKTRADMEDWLKKNPGHEGAEVIETSKFPGLKPGLWAVLFERCQDRDDADARAKTLSQSGISAYAKKAK